MTRGPITEFMLEHYKHFNAATVIDASRAWEEHLAGGGKMFVTIAGAMSTAELRLSLAEMIRQDKIHGICCTGANLEEDVFNLVAHDYYERVPDWRDLTPDDEHELLERGLNRVTDTCIPEDEAMRRIEAAVNRVWRKPGRERRALLPARVPVASCSRTGELAEHYQIDPKDSLDAGRLREEPADLRPRLGRFDPRQHVRRRIASRRHQERAHRRSRASRR